MACYVLNFPGITPPFREASENHVYHIGHVGLSVSHSTAIYMHWVIKLKGGGGGRRTNSCDLIVGGVRFRTVTGG